MAASFSMNRRWGWRRVKSGLANVLCTLAALITVAPLVFVLAHMVREAFSAINWHFFPHLPKPVGETGGGMANAIVGTFTLLALASAIGIPVGVLGGVFLSEYGSARISWPLRFAADLLNGVPSIIWGIAAWGLLVSQELPYLVWDEQGPPF